MTRLPWMVAAFFITGTLFAQPKLIDREKEAAEFPDLMKTEDNQEKNILDANKRLGTFGPLVTMAKEDRRLTFEEQKDPTNFKNTFRYVKYTPRNTYVRYVKESPEFVLAGLGEVPDLQALIREKATLAQSLKINAKEIQFQTRDGVELTQFEFIWRQDPDKRRPIGSRRKSVTLYYTQVANTPDTENNYQLSMVVTRVVQDDFEAGVKDVELIIDPSPLDEQMEDVIVMHRYNQKVANANYVSMMANTPNFPHRVVFKQKFYVKLTDHFVQLYRMVDAYAKKDGNDYNDAVIDDLKQSLDY